MPVLDYENFLRSKVALASRQGRELEAGAIHPALKPHQQAIVQWAVRGGRRGIFAAFGLGKTLIQLEILRQVLATEGGAGLIVLPLGVRQEFMRDAALIGVEPRFIRQASEIEPRGIHLTNYETVRDGKLDPSLFTVASLDEASALRGFGGTKTFREFMRLFAPVRYRYVATATPSPNEYIEILSYSAFLGIMDVGEAKTRFFKRDSTRADKLTLHAHKEREFWLWVASWGLFLQRPSDLGAEYSDEGYALPELDVRWHEVASDHSQAGVDREGQGIIFCDPAIGVTAAASEKRNSLGARIAKMLELRAEAPMAHRLIWHDLEAEREAIQRAVPGAVAVWGNQELEERERRVIAFSDGEIQELASKPVLLGSGCNFQRHCSRAIFLGIGFKFNDFIQAIHRIHRFLQPNQVRIDIIYTEAEREIRRALEAKWERHKQQQEVMARIIREYGLAHEALSRALVRSIGVERREASGKLWRAVCNDCVLEARELPSDSAGLILTSIPFATQYEYTPCYDAETEVLTHCGWQSFGTLTRDDELATINPQSLRLEWQQPTEIVWQPYHGPMLHFHSRGAIDLLVTPDHKMFVNARVGNHKTGRKGQDYKLIPAADIARDFVVRKWRMLATALGSDGMAVESVSIPKLARGKRGPRAREIGAILATDFMRIAGWYLAEGSCDPIGHEYSRHAGRISISQSRDVNPYNVADIEALFRRIGLPTRYEARSVVVHNRAIAKFLSEQFGRGSHAKRIPRWVKDLCSPLLVILRDTMMRGDGNSNGMAYTSYSQQLRDDFQEICLLTGWRAAIDGKVVRISQSRSGPEIRRRPNKHHYDGMIGCATVPNHTLVVRRNGKAIVSGNSYNDFGHTDDNAHFWQQMDYLTPELLRVLQPGRVAAIHVKDRIIPGGLSGLGFQTVAPFHCEAIEHFTSHGFAYLGMKTIVTDVVRENNQTYRLGWTEQCKDGSRMGVGMPEYLLLFRRPPSDLSNGYADVPVVKDKPLCDDHGQPAPFDSRRNWKCPIPGTGYSRARWQMDAHGFSRSSGNRLLSSAELAELPHEALYKLWRERSLANVYDFESHVAVAEDLDHGERLPATFMLFPPHSWHPEVWSDVARMRTLNSSQAAAGREMHLCPLQFDIADRAINQYTMPGELVLDPFAGIMTVAYCAVRLGRRGLGIELNAGYWADGVSYLKAVEDEVAVPSLFSGEQL